MLCPKCNSEMREKSYRGITVDVCSACRGIFLDKGELERIEDQQLGNIIDACGYSQRREDLDRVEATCHRCGKTMLALRGAGDIVFDWCESCEGIFFDKGELASLHFFRDV